MKKKKIVVLHYSLVMGGAEKVLINMLNALDYNRVEVTLWLLESGGILEKELTDNVEIKYFDCSKLASEVSWTRMIKNKLKQFKIISAFQISLYLLFYTLAKRPEAKMFFDLKKYGLLDKKHYDLLIDYTGYHWELLYWGLARFYAKKRVLWIHGEGNFNPTRTYAYKMYNRIFAVSKSIKNYFLNLYPELSSKTEVFYNIQDIDGILSKSEELCIYEMLHPAIVTVGRISPEKGMDRIPECLEKLCNVGYNVHWYIVGDGPDREKIENVSKEKNLLENIHFLGIQKNPYPYMKNCDIYVQPSKTEGFCTTTLEAKVLKKPIIVTDVPGMREQFVDGETAVILKEQSTDELFKEVKNLLDNSELREKLTESLSMTGNAVSNDLSQLYSLLK